MANTILGSMGVMSGPQSDQRANPSDQTPTRPDVGAIAQKYRIPRNVLMALEEQGEDPEAKAAEIATAMQQGQSIEDVVPYASLRRATDIADEIEGIEPEGGFRNAFGAGVDNVQQALGSAVEGAGVSLGLEGVQNYGATVAENNAAEAQSRSRGLTGLSDVDGVGSGASYVADTLGQQVPQLGTTLGPVATGAAIGSLAGPGGTAVGAGVGAAVAFAGNLAQFYGFNRERQKEENDGVVNEGAAFGTAIPQAATDLASDAITLVPFIGPAAKTLAAGNMGSRILAGAALGAAAEAPTEAAQQAMERAQAGLSLTDEDARSEYVESAVAGGLVGGIFGGARGGLSRRPDDQTPPPPEVDPETGQLLLPPPAATAPPRADGGPEIGPNTAGPNLGSDGSATGQSAGAEVVPSSNAPAFDEIPDGAQIDATEFGYSSWDVPSPSIDISTEGERGDSIRDSMDAMLRSTGLTDNFDRSDYLDAYNDLNSNGGNVEDAVWSQLNRSADRAEQADWQPIAPYEGEAGGAFDTADASRSEQLTIDEAADGSSPEGNQGRDGADAGQADAVDATQASPYDPQYEGDEVASRARGATDFAAGLPRRMPPEIDPTDAVAANAWYRGWDEANIAAPVEGVTDAAPLTMSQRIAEADPTPDAATSGISIRNVRQKAAVLMGVPKDSPPDVGNLSLKWDEKEGGFLLARANSDKILKAAMDQAAVDTPDAQAPRQNPSKPPSEPLKTVLTDDAKPVAAAADETAPDPTPAQAEAENYKTGKAKWNGLNVSIENKKGSTRSKVGPDGKTAWSVTMPAHYGRILGTIGADGDHVDFYMGDMEDSDFVLIVNQVDTETGKFDEHKVILGTGGEAAARGIYEKGFSDGKGRERIGSATPTSVAGFKSWIDNADLTKPTEPVKTTSPTESRKTSPKLSSDADRPMPDLSKLDYEGFDDQTREDGQNNPGKREARSQTGRWARATVKALKDAGFTPTLARKGKPMKAVGFGYAMSGEPDETSIYLTAPNGVEFYAKIHKSVMTRDGGLTILVQFRGEPEKPGYSKPLLGGNKYLEADLRPSEAAEKIIDWAARLDPKPKEVKKAATAPLDPQPRGSRRMDWWWTNNSDQRRTALKAAGVNDLFDGQTPVMSREVQDKLNPEQYEALKVAIFGPKEAETSKPDPARTKAITNINKALTPDNFSYDGMYSSGQMSVEIDETKDGDIEFTIEQTNTSYKGRVKETRVKGLGSYILSDIEADLTPVSMKEVKKFREYYRNLPAPATVTSKENNDAIRAATNGMAFEKMDAATAGRLLEVAGVARPTDARIKELIEGAGRVDGTAQGNDFALINTDSEGYAATGLKKYTFGESAWVQQELLATKKLRKRGGFLTMTDAFEDELSGYISARSNKPTPPKPATDAEIDDAQNNRPETGPPTPATGLLSGLSAEKQARAAELKAKLAAKVRNQTSSGLDPDYIILGGELIGLYIEGGAKKFGQMLRDFAETTGLSMREAQEPMRAAYNHVRDNMDLDGQDVSDMDDGAAVMVEVRAAIKAEQESSQNDADGPILNDEASNEGQNGTDTEQQNPRMDNRGLEEPESERGIDNSGSERSGERGDISGSPRDGEPSGDGDNVAGGMVGNVLGGSGNEAAERKGLNPGNFVIPDDFNLGAGTPGQKIDENIAAIRLVKALQSENRHATKAEQKALARYIGWGGLKRVFDPNETGKTSQWGRAQADMRELLTPDQYRAAAYSTAHAHYTSPDVVGAMWGAMRGFGFTGGRALEPTVGTGNFLGLQPQDMAEKTEWYAAELDDITGAIAEYLYPDATVFAGQGFENAPFRPNTIDVAIGNPPFGSEKIKSGLHPDIPPMSVHNYIIGKTGVLLRPGGIMGMVVTSRFLDTPNPQGRSYLSKQFNFMGAVRLPNTAFKANAGTDVTTDIVWFQKRRDGDAAGDMSWLETGVERDGVMMNGYFAANPDMMLGTPSMQGTMYGPDPEFTLEDDGRDLPTAMRDAMNKIEGALPDRETQLEDAVVAAKTTSDLGIGESMLDDDGKVMIRLEDVSGNAVVEEVTAKSPWGKITRELMAARDAIGSAAEAIKVESVEVAADAVKTAIDTIVNTGAITEKGTVKPNAPTGMGKDALAAIKSIYEGLSDENPYFGPNQKRALRELKKAVDAKTIGPKNFAALQAMLTLRSDALALLASETRDDPKMKDQRNSLRRKYRAFVKKHGYVNDPSNDALVNGFPGIEAALETKYVKANKGQGIKASAEEAAILSQRIISPYQNATKADSAIDGVPISLRERGRLDLGLIADLTGKPIKDVTEELTSGEKPYVFYDPKRSEYVIADEYLSGNIAEKIEEARDNGANENIPHLESAMPADKTAEQVTPSIRSLWIPKEVFEAFLKELGAATPKVTINMKAANIDVVAGGDPSEFGQLFQTERKSVFDVFKSAARGKAIMVYDKAYDGKQVKNEKATQDANAAVARLSEEFQKWAYVNSERKSSIVDAFNEKMNVIVPRTYDGVSYLTQVGANPNIKMRNSQKNGAWRMMLSNSTLLHHVVGAGKTFTAITAIMERKRLGLSKKSLVAVPNHIVSQWARDFYELYPGANILAASEKDFSKANRRKLISRIATGDYDAIIIGHSALRQIKNNAEETKALMQEQLTDLEDAAIEARRSGSSRANISQIASRIKKYKEKMDAMLKTLEGDNLGFDFASMGVDNLVIDEAHEFKNLEYATSSDRLVGMNNPDGSQRALDLYIKTRGLMARKGSVGFLTGTPVSNSLVEIFTIMKYMAPETMRSMNLMQYDSWASTFVQSKTKFELTAAQKLKERNVLAGLSNLGPLSDLYRSFADVVMRKEVEAMYTEQMEAENKKNNTNLPTRFPTPKVKGGKRQLVNLPSSPDQDEFTDYLVMRMGGIQANKSDKTYASKDNALWILSDARKASIDIRTVDPYAQRHENSKVVAVGRDTLRLANATSADRGTQLIFADSSVPTKTAKASIKAAIKSAWEKSGMTGPEATERLKKDAEAGKAWSVQWGDVVAAIESSMESGNLTEKKQEAIEEWMNGEDAAEGAASAFTADTGFSFYDDLKAYLVEEGMNPEEIAFIHDYKTADQKSGLFEAVNEGKIRVLIGSTFKMGAGTNAQRRLVGLRHVDAPWRPSDMEQREGRIIRPGNELYKADPDGFEVEITAYTTEKTSDVVLWQVLERKAAGIEQFLNASADNLVEDSDSDADVYANFMARSTGNPAFLRKMETEKAVRDTESAQSSMRLMVSDAKNFIDNYDSRVEYQERRMEAVGKVSFDAYPDAGASWNQFKKDKRDYDQAKEAYEAKAESVRESNKKLAKGEKREKLPEFVLEPPKMLEGKLDAYSQRVKDAIQEAMDTGESSTIKIGAGTISIGKLITKDEGVSQYHATFKVPGHQGIKDVMGFAAVVRNPFNSRALISAMMPESVMESVKFETRNAQRTIDRMVEAKPDMERKAKTKVDRTELNELKRDLEMYQGLVRVSEVQNAQARLGKTNRFATMDTKDRDLDLSKTDDAPLLPEDGKPFTFTSSGQTYTSDMGAKAGSYTDGGSQVSTYFFEATAQDGSPALVKANRTTIIDASKDGGDPKDPTLELVEVFDTSKLTATDAEMRELRGVEADREVTGEDIRNITKDLNAELETSGLSGKVSVRVVKRLISLTSGNDILGRFEADKGITVRAAGGIDERGIMRHEIIHALRSTNLWNSPNGLFTPAEWRGLARAARADKGIRDNVMSRYASEPAAMQSEEMVAEMYRLWSGSRDGYSGVESALAKIEAFLGAIANMLRGRGFGSASMTMERIARGDVGGRGPTNPDGNSNAPADGSEMRAPAGAVRDKFKGLVGKANWGDAQGFVSNKITDAMAGKGDFSLLALVPGRPLFAELGKRLVAAQTYLKHKEDMDQTRNDWHNRADTVSQKWLKDRNKDPRANEALMDLMHRSTLAKTDPSQRYDGSDATMAKKQVAERGDNAPEWAKRKVAENELRKKTHGILKGIYDNLPSEFQSLYGEIRAEYDKMGDDFEDAVLVNVENSMRVALKSARKTHAKALRKITDDGLKGDEKADATADADETLRKAVMRNETNAASKMQSLRAMFEGGRLTGPYFPLARFGQYFVTVRDENKEVISFAQFENEASQETHIKEMEAANPGRVKHGIMETKTSMKDQVSPSFVADVEAMLGDADVSPELMDAIWQKWLSTMPDQSIRTSKIHRKGRAGWSEDAFRAFGKHMFHGAHQLARLKHGVLLEEALGDARDEARLADNPNRASALVNEMSKRHAFTMNPTGSSVVASMSSLAFVWYLGASPASAIVNLSQTTIMGPPIMAAKFQKAGIKGSLTELYKAAKDFGDGKGYVENSKRLTKDEKAAVEEGYRRGMDKTQGHDLASVAETGIEYNAVREKWMKKIGFMFHHAERMNREVTFLANYRLGRTEGMSHADATDVAHDLTNKIHFSYQNTDRPRFMQSDIGKLLTIFRQFTVNMIYRMFRDAHQSLNGVTKDERREARAQLVGITLSMMAHAGIKGTFGYGIIMGLLALFFPGDADDLEDWMQDALLMEGDDFATASWNYTMGMALNGVPGQITGLNLTSRIGMPDLWFRGSNRDLEGRDVYAHYVKEMLGPVYGIGEGFVRGAYSIGEGEFGRGLEGMVPKFLRDPIKTGRYAAEGVQTWNGDPIVENPTPWELLMQANGFTSARVAERYDINNRLKNREREIMGERSGLHRAAGDALREGGGISGSVMDKIRDFNARFPEYPITGDSIRQSYRGRQRASQRNEFGVSLNPRLNARLRGEVTQPIYN